MCKRKLWDIFVLTSVSNTVILRLPSKIKENIKVNNQKTAILIMLTHFVSSILNCYLNEFRSIAVNLLLSDDLNLSRASWRFWSLKTSRDVFLDSSRTSDSNKYEMELIHTNTEIMAGKTKSCKFEFSESLNSVLIMWCVMMVKVARKKANWRIWTKMSKYFRKAFLFSAKFRFLAVWNGREVAWLLL